MEKTKQIMLNMERKRNQRKEKKKKENTGTKSTIWD